MPLGAGGRSIRVWPGPGGRSYRVRIDLTYLKGTLPADEREALRDALQRGIPRVTLSVVPRPHNVVAVTVILRADHSLDAIAEVSNLVDQALLGTGLFEVFDATGRALRVAPLEQANPIDDPW
jgi:hypothetical protein